MRRCQNPVAAYPLLLLCLALLPFLLIMAGSGHVQAKRVTRPGTPVRPEYAIGVDDALRPLSPPTVAFSPDDISVDLTSRFVYLSGSKKNQRQPSTPRHSPSPVRVEVHSKR